MSLAILSLTILVAVGGFIDFLIGPPGHRRVKAQLVEFYVALEDGDWTALYRRPANALLQFMNRLLDPNQFSIRYVLRTLLLSLSMTTILFLASMVWTYIAVAMSEQRCAVPPVSQFLEIVPYMHAFLAYVIVINFVFDYCSWSLTRGALRLIARSKGIVPLAISMISPALIIAFLYVIYSIYLPLTIVVEMHDYGAKVGFDQYRQIFFANLRSNLDLIQVPKLLFHLSCPTSSHTFFSISYISTMQILGIEIITPILLLFLASIFGVIAFLTKPLSKRPLSFLIERIDSSGQRVTVLMIGLAAGILAVLIAIAKFRTGAV